MRFGNGCEVMAADFQVVKKVMIQWVCVMPPEATVRLVSRMDNIILSTRDFFES